VIIGKYSVNPLDVIYGSYRFDPECNSWEFTIYATIDSMTTPLTQWNLDKKEIDKWIRKVDKCVEIRRDFIIESDTVNNEEDDD